MELKTRNFDEIVGTNPSSTTPLLLKDPALLEDLVSYFLNTSGRKRFYAIWHLDHLNQAASSLLEPYKELLLEQLILEERTGTQREVLKILQDHTLNEESLGVLINYCFNRLNSVDCPVAVKMHCMLHLERACGLYPELAHELTESIQMQMENASAGFKSRAKKILRKFS